MTGEKYVIDRDRAELILASIRGVCEFRNWNLLAAHVRTTHVHCVVDGDLIPNRAIGDFKAYASRILNQLDGEQTRWAREGSVRRLLTRETEQAAIRYVANGQGAPMAV